MLIYKWDQSHGVLGFWGFGVLGRVIRIDQLKV